MTVVLISWMWNNENLVAVAVYGLGMPMLMPLSSYSCHTKISSVLTLDKLNTFIRLNVHSANPSKIDILLPQGALLIIGGIALHLVLLFQLAFSPDQLNWLKLDWKSTAPVDKKNKTSQKEGHGAANDTPNVNTDKAKATGVLQFRSAFHACADVYVRSRYSTVEAGNPWDFR